ncbi:anti-FecI sigma factor, FecR [gut metagenome]|uniref:Anti-FecI sigma factor, FecR n=1 Tax=gut metagenome TaxID=749906 RepID=J9GPI0_9ZZZZ
MKKDSQESSSKHELFRSLWQESLAQQPADDVDQQWQHWLRMRIRSNGVRSLRILRIWQSVAAVLLIAVGLLAVRLRMSPVSSIDLIQQYIPVAEMRHLTLPDGTRVQLNSKSTLIYPERFTGDERSVYLVGEANFQVKPDSEHPFIVKSDDFQVTALGTEFNVSAYPEQTEIQTVLLSGSVQVDFDAMSQSHRLQPSEQLCYHRGSHRYHVDRPDLDDITAWQRGELVYNSRTVLEIIQRLERRYNYEFVYSLSSLKDDRYSFRFHKDASLQAVMEILTDVTGYLTFEIRGKQCILRRR